MLWTDRFHSNGKQEPDISGRKKKEKKTEIMALFSIGYGAYEGLKVNDRDYFDIIQQKRATF
jgi:hypothetical protein